MKHKRLFALPLLVIPGLALFTRAYADDSDKDKLGPYKLLTTITIPVAAGTVPAQGLVANDIS